MQLVCKAKVLSDKDKLVVRSVKQEGNTGEQTELYTVLNSVRTYVLVLYSVVFCSVLYSYYTVPVTEIEISICHNCITPVCHSTLRSDL